MDENDYTFCCDCKYISPVLMPYDAQFRKYFCLFNTGETIDFVLGTAFVNLALCSETNTDGHCKFFVPGESERLKWARERHKTDKD